jgi:probable rRNA maturation factor
MNESANNRRALSTDDDPPPVDNADDNDQPLTKPTGSLALTVTNQTAVPLPSARLRQIAELICADFGIHSGELSLVVVDDQQMRALHHEFLGDDASTDVLAFPLQKNDGFLQGEVIVCWDVAAETATELGCTALDELLLYIAHGVLHLVGLDDTNEADFQRMRQAEIDFLARIGVQVIDRAESAHPEEHRS